MSTPSVGAGTPRPPQGTSWGVDSHHRTPRNVRSHRPTTDIVSCVDRDVLYTSHYHVETPDSLGRGESTMDSEPPTGRTGVVVRPGSLPSSRYTYCREPGHPYRFQVDSTVVREGTLYGPVTP